MNFFQEQERARRKTFALVAMLSGAVLALIGLSFLAAAGFFTVLDAQASAEGASLSDRLDWPLGLSIAGVVISVVVAGALYKGAQLRGGGASVAASLGGIPISPSSRDPAERRVLNVVEEMAIASGMPVPPVYLLDDDAINAFAAGNSPHTAVIGVTRGCIRLLSRDELQAVIAHEFSHILHGDMRLNMRLVALLHGLLLVGLLGRVLLRGAGHRSSRRSNNGNVALLGVLLVVVGYAGTLCGSLIRAAVSRQREFLADAAAVQYTRNPDGIAGALKKIGGHVLGSQLSAPRAAEFSHMYFGAGLKPAWFGLFASHPPLPERIRRVEPRWDGEFPLVREEPVAEEAAATAADATAMDGLGQVVDGLVASIGQPQAVHLLLARQVIDELDGGLYAAVHSPEGAQAVLFGLLLSPDARFRNPQLKALAESRNGKAMAQLAELDPVLRALPARQRLPLVELAAPALKRLPVAEHLAFVDGLGRLIAAAGPEDLAGWALGRVILHAATGGEPASGRLALGQCEEAAITLLSAIAHAGHADPGQAGAAFAAGAAELGLSQASLRGREALLARDLDQALDRLNQVRPLQKPLLLKAMARCAEHDGRLEPEEMELLRALADGLDCPMPPLALAGGHPGAPVQASAEAQRSEA